MICVHCLRRRRLRLPARPCLACALLRAEDPRRRFLRACHLLGEESRNSFVVDWPTDEKKPDMSMLNGHVQAMRQRECYNEKPPDHTERIANMKNRRKS